MPRRQGSSEPANQRDSDQITHFLKIHIIPFSVIPSLTLYLLDRTNLPLSATQNPPLSLKTPTLFHHSLSD